MKVRSLRYCALLGAVAVAPVHAQSSITLYGLIDEGLSFSSNAKGHQLYSLNASNLQGDRWGLRGVESLSSDLGVIFALENGFNINNGAFGQGGALFGRQAYVGLQSRRYGSLTMGRQFDALLDGVSGFMFGNDTKQGGRGQLGGAMGSHVGDIDNLDNTYRVNNAVMYTSPNLSGLRFEGQYGFGGVAGDVSRNQIWSTSVSYAEGPVALGIGFEKINDPNYSYYGNNPSGSATASNITTPVYSGFASAHSQQILTAGGNYKVGNAILGAVYSNVRFTDIGAVAGTGLNPHNLSGTAAFNIGEVNFGYFLSSAWLVGASYVYTHGASVENHPAAKYQQLTFGSDYTLSKRTDLYAIVALQRASGYDSTVQPAVASIVGLTPSSSNKQAGVVFGVRTRF